MCLLNSEFQDVQNVAVFGDRVLSWCDMDGCAFLTPKYWCQPWNDKMKILTHPTGWPCEGTERTSISRQQRNETLWGILVGIEIWQDLFRAKQKCMLTNQVVHEQIANTGKCWRLSAPADSPLDSSGQPPWQPSQGKCPSGHDSNSLLFLGRPQTSLYSHCAHPLSMYQHTPMPFWIVETRSCTMLQTQNQQQLGTKMASGVSPGDVQIFVCHDTKLTCPVLHDASNIS